MSMGATHDVLSLSDTPFSSTPDLQTCKPPKVTQKGHFWSISSIWIHREQGLSHFHSHTIPMQGSLAACTLLSIKCAKSTIQSLPVGTLYGQEPKGPSPEQLSSLEMVNPLPSRPYHLYLYIIPPIPLLLLLLLPLLLLHYYYYSCSAI